MEYDETLLQDKVTQVASKAFGISYLYPWQRLVIENILDSEPEHSRQIVLLPTGAGKSLCFLVPALIFEKPTLIIYPLLALMADQQRRMSEAGLESVVFKGSQTDEERKQNFLRIKQGVKIILANPEVLQNEHLIKQLSECRIQHIAIDEAHCVYEWGSTFRPAYLTLGKIARQLAVPVMTAFTATASPEVLSKIEQILFNGNAHIVRSAGDRPNIHYYVINCFNKKKKALKLAVTSEKPVLIFCGTRIKAEDMAREIAIYYEDGRNVRFYHAGLSKEEKEAIEKWFYPKTDACLCATVAFGMGIDKKNIRTVIHLEPSSSAEAYLQEAGRAGRDGEVSKAYLLWSPSDTAKSRIMAEYAKSTTCRRQFLLDALGAEQAVCSGCDICETGKPAPFAEDALMAQTFIRRYRKMYNRDELCFRLMEKMNDEDTKCFGICLWEHKDIEIILSQMENEGMIKTLRFPWKGRITTCSRKKDNIL